VEASASAGVLYPLAEKSVRGDQERIAQKLTSWSASTYFRHPEAGDRKNRGLSNASISSAKFFTSTRAER
jgi:hypothetical protein